MNYGSEPADQVVRYSLEGAEFALRISGTAAKGPQRQLQYQPPAIRARPYDPGRGAPVGQQQVHFVYPWGTTRD